MWIECLVGILTNGSYFVLHTALFWLSASSASSLISFYGSELAVQSKILNLHCLKAASRLLFFFWGGGGLSACIVKEKRMLVCDM